MNKTRAYPYNLLEDIRHKPFQSVLTKDQMNGLEYALNQLKKRWKEVILLIYRDKQTLRSVGEKFGISTERARQLRDRALRKLRRRHNIIFGGLEHTRKFEQKQMEANEKGLELKQRWFVLMREQVLLEKEMLAYKDLAKKFHVDENPFIELIRERAIETSKMFYSLIGIEELELSRRAYKRIECDKYLLPHINYTGIHSVAQLMEVKVDILREMDGLGEKTLDEIIEKVLQFTGHDIREN